MNIVKQYEPDTCRFPPLLLIHTNTTQIPFISFPHTLFSLSLHIPPFSLYNPIQFNSYKSDPIHLHNSHLHSPSIHSPLSIC
ncbi:hypothetical protein QVD17_31591 [Tagetes erecta]|uniref:Uncharacterized protein n=1 Tax=Tagetes erecta TaxID=13708 RepID=A0AAD8NNN9_TARER|nr:hypothetical protein QVD17_31591 [Tagetes erecta]